MAHDDKGHLESNDEYRQRIHRRMDEDTWQGVDTVGNDMPGRAIVHDITPADEQEPPHIWNYGGRKPGY